MWYGNSSNQDCKALQRVVRLAERISGSTLFLPYICSCAGIFISFFILLHCPLSGPDLMYISLLIIPCIIYYVTNKETLTLEVLNDSSAGGLLPLSCRRAVLTLLPKKGDMTDIKCWRPVSLLCSDYKLLSKVLANRLAESYTS